MASKRTSGVVVAENSTLRLSYTKKPEWYDNLEIDEMVNVVIKGKIERLSEQVKTEWEKKNYSISVVVESSAIVNIEKPLSIGSILKKIEKKQNEK